MGLGGWGVWVYDGVCRLSELPGLNATASKASVPSPDGLTCSQDSMRSITTEIETLSPKPETRNPKP